MNKSLRILQVVEATFDGVGRHVLDLSEYLLQHGHRVDLAWSPDRSEQRFIERLASLPFGAVLELPSGSSTWKGVPAAVTALLRFARQNGPYDIVHGHSSRGGAWSRVLPLPATRVYTPNALITQSTDIGRSRRWVFAAVELMLSLRTTGLIHVSEEEALHAEALGLRPRSTTVIPNGIELRSLPSRQEARRALGLGQEELVFGTVGRLATQKGHDRLIDAFSLYVDRGGPGSLLIVGEGPDRHVLGRQVSALGLTDRVRFAGRQPGQESMPAFDVFVLASRYEGFPYVVLEAMWAGLPVVVSNQASVSAIVDSGTNAIAVPPRPEELAHAMGQLAESSERRIELGQQASAAVQRFSAQEMARAVEAYYLQLLQQHGE